MDNSHDYMSLRDAAKYLGVNRTWLAGAVAALGIPTMALGTAKVIKRTDLEKVRKFKPEKVGA